MRLDHLLLGRTEVVYFSQSTSNPSRGRVRVKLTQPYFLYSFLIKLGAPFVRGICFLSQARPDFFGGIAQLGEHLPCKQGVSGSIPLTSTNNLMLYLTETMISVTSWSDLLRWAFEIHCLI